MADPSLSSALGAPRVELFDRHMVVSLPGPHQTLSWAIAGGGLHRTDLVVWHQVYNNDIGAGVDPAQLLAERLQANGHANAVGLMTSAPLASWWSAGAAQPIASSTRS